LRHKFLSLPFSNSLFSLFMCSRTQWCSSFCSFRREVSGGSGGGWPAGAAAPPRRNPRLCFFLNFFRLISSTPSSDLVSGLKIPKIFIKRPRSKKKKILILFFEFEPFCNGLVLDVWFGCVCVLMPWDHGFDCCCCFLWDSVLDCCYCLWDWYGDVWIGYGLCCDSVCFEMCCAQVLWLWLPPFWLLLQVYLSRDEPWPPRVKENVDDSLCWAVLDNFFWTFRKTINNK